MVLSSGILRKNSDHVARNVGGEVILVPIRNRVEDLDNVFVMRDVGAYVWGMIDGANSVAEIVQRVVGAYDVSVEQAARDMDELIASLEQEGIVSWVITGPGPS